MNLIQRIQDTDGRFQMNGVPPGHDAFIISQWAASQGRIMVITPDDVSMVQLAATIAFFDPAMPVLRFPAWDCLPYDRVSPSGDVLDQRIRVLAKLIEDTDTSTPCVVVTTVSAALQRLVPRAGLDGRSLVITKGAEVPVDDIVTFLSRNGYVRADTVLEPGEYARRGGILDVFPAGHDTPVRMDFFGDEIDVFFLFKIFAFGGIKL